jgi:hypothetical protein
MKNSLVEQLTLGLYFLYWKEGGGSVAAVGMDERGRHWYAPTNWISVPSFNWFKVEKVELLTTQSHELEKRGLT